MERSVSLSTLGSVLMAVLLAPYAPGVAAQHPPEQAVDPLGSVDFHTSCRPSVAAEFNRGVALLHHMTYPLAQESFEAVIAGDPACGLAYWGAAMTRFQPLWPNRPGPDELRRGWELTQEARRRVEPGGRESSWVATGEAFFDPAGDPDYWTRIDRWEAAARATYEADPTDPEAIAFYALAHLAAGSHTGTPSKFNAEAAELLARLVATNPTHPGAVHYTIHANDIDGRERDAIDVVRSYADIAPRNPHALHMPTHIFVRLGWWDDVILGNEHAAAAALEQRVGPGGEYVWDEFPHAVEYLVYAHLQKADDEAARELIASLGETPDLQPSFKTAFHLASTAARYALERQDWRGAMALPVRTPPDLDWDAFPWPESISWFARGMGAAHLDSGAGVRESLDHLAALSSRARASGEGVFGEQIEILRLELAGWQAFLEGDPARAEAALVQAVDLEHRTAKPPVTPAATIPAGELLGDLYLALSNPESALRAYRESNGRAPGRLNTIVGLARASAAVGDMASARARYEELLSHASSASTRPALAEAEAFLERKRR